MPAGQEDGVLRIGKRFVEIHGRQPHCIALAPGRVNLIGEHIDYNGYSVLPIATNHTVRVATSIDTHANSSLRREDNDDAGAAAAMVDITIAHADGEQGGHPARRITKHKHTGVPLDWSGEFASGPHWTNYVLAGILCWSDTDAMSDESSSIEIGVLVDGDIPQAAGLSSSSALVVASALATLSLHPSPPSLTCTHIAELCTHTERRVGTAGGGMDQSAIMCCRRGAALHVQFSPLRVSVVPLPTSRVVFVVAHSLVESPKAVQAATHYNKRVFECSLALAILDEAVGGFLGADDVVRSTLADFQRSRQLCHDGCRSLVRQHIREEAYTKVARQVPPRELPWLPIGTSISASTRPGALRRVCVCPHIQRRVRCRRCLARRGWTPSCGGWAGTSGRSTTHSSRTSGRCMSSARQPAWPSSCSWQRGHRGTPMPQ